MYANITRPITPADEMRREMARMNRNMLELAEGSRQNRRNERRHTIGILENIRSLMQKPPRAICLCIAVLTLCQLTPACSITNSISAMTESCVQKDAKTMECSFKQSLQLAFQARNQTNCVLLSDNDNRPFGAAVLSVPEIRLVCKPEIRFFTRDYVMKATSSKRCPLSGSCQYGTCSNISLQSHIPELGAANHMPGFSFCEDSPSCWLSGCFICNEPACLFYRTYANPVDEKIGTIFSCPSWEVQVIVNIDISHGSKISKHSVNLKLDSPQAAVDGLSLALISVTTPPATYLTNEFLTDDSRTAVLPRLAAAGAPQCDTRESAKEFNKSCTLKSSTCSCRSAGYQARCNCQTPNPMAYLRDRAALLPKVIGGTTLKQSQGIVYSETQISDLQLQLTMENFKMKVKTDFSQCFIEPSPLKGCGDCGQGAEFTYLCYTNRGEALAHVTCPSSNFSVHCDVSKVMRKTILTLPSGKLQEECELRCPDSKVKFVLRGDLHLASSRDLVIESLTSLNVSQPSFSVGQWLKVVG